MERDKQEKSIAEAIAFAEKYCSPEDSQIISEIDIHARNAAWQLLNQLKNNGGTVCSTCGAATTEEGQQEVAQEESKLEKVNNETQAILDAAAAKEIHSKGFFDHVKKRATAIGFAGLLSLASGAYFQVETVKQRGYEIAIICEQQYGVFTSLNKWLINTFNYSLFNDLITNANNSKDTASSDISKNDSSKTVLNTEDKGDSTLIDPVNPSVVSDVDPPINPTR